MVGCVGLEPTTTSSQTMHSTTELTTDILYKEIIKLSLPLIKTKTVITTFLRIIEKNNEYC